MSKIVNRAISIRHFQSSTQITIGQFSKGVYGDRCLERMHTFTIDTNARAARIRKALNNPYLECGVPFLEMDYQAHYYHLPKFYPVKVRSYPAEEEGR